MLTTPLDLARPALAALDYAAVGVFALSGALAAARAKQAIVTFAFFAAVTGIGGGTLRDLLIGAPVFWVANQGYLGVCLMAAALVWVIDIGERRLAWLLWLDAVGLAAYAVVGAAKALSYGTPPLVAVVMGVLTASFGGIIRDVLGGTPSVLLGREIYVSAAALAALIYTGLRLLGVDPIAAGIVGALSGFALRAAALGWGVTLPGYRER